MEMKKWHENIPKNGVLCKQLDGSYKLITSIEHDYHLNDCTTYGVSEYGEDDIEDLSPLTAAEWWDFAPWLDIESAPDDAWVLILDTFNTTHMAIKIGGQWDESYFTPVKWLPLPTGDL